MLPGTPVTYDFLSRKDTPFQGGVPDVSSAAQTEEDKEKVKLAWGMLKDAKQWRAQWDKNWERFRNAWEGNHFQGKAVFTLTRAVVNMVHANVETFVGHVSDVLGYPKAHARRPDYIENAKTIGDWLKYEWQQSNAGYEIQHCIRDAAITGVGWAEIPWDETLSGNRGDVAFDPVDSKYIFLSPHSRNLKDALYLIDARNVPREYVERTFEKGKTVPPGPWDGTLGNVRVYSQGNSDSEQFAEWKTSDGSQSSWAGSAFEGSDKKRKDIVTLLRCYIRTEDGGMRLLVVCNGVVLQDGPSPYEDDDYPYIQFNLIPTLDTYCGRSLIQFVEGLQEILDVSLSCLLDQQRYASDPMLVVDIENVEEGSLIDNMPGAVLFNRSQRQGYNWLTAPGFNQAWIEVQKITAEYMDNVLGRVDVLKGEKPPGVDTLGGLEIIRDEANVRIRNLVRWVRATVKRGYLLILSRLRQYAKSERTIRLQGRFGQEEFRTVNEIKGVSQDGTPEQDFTIPDDVEFDIEFGEEEPGGRQAKMERALKLAQTPAEDGLPMVTRSWVLNELEIKEAPEIIGEIQQMAQMQQQAQAAQAAPQEGAAPGAPDPNARLEDPMGMIMKVFGGG